MAIFGEGKIFGKLQRLHSLDTLWVENFDEIALSGTVKEIEAIKFVFCHFWQKFENSKWPPFLGRGKFFENCKDYSLDTLWVENFDEIALSRTVKEIEARQKFENSKWPPFLGRGKFLKNYQE